MALKFAVNNSLSAITTLPSSISGGALNLISTQTASASASLEFTTGIDSTYDVYVFKFINCHPSEDAGRLQVNFSTDGGSNYNVTKTSTSFRSYHNEADSSTLLDYTDGFDMAQETGFKTICAVGGNDNDQSASGEMYLYNPSSTTFVKHFIATTHTYGQNDASYSLFSAGYGNTTSAINGVKFIMHSGNIDSGTIKLYGIGD